MTDEPRRRMVEAIAAWQLELPGCRQLLSSTAALLLTEGIDGRAVVEMASIYPEESRFRIDALVENLIGELRLESHLSSGPDVPATRWICRGVLAGEIDERSLSRWVHSRFHHESDVELLDEIALLDDEYDDAEAASADLAPIRLRIRALAKRIVDVE